MLHSIKIYLLCLPFTLLLDYIWLAKLMQGFYQTQLGPYARVRGATIIPVYWAAAIVYLLLPLGIVLFVLPRVNQERLAVSSLAWGALFGLIVYGVYDMTNMATLERWPVRMVWVDICWGCFLCGATTWFAAAASPWMQ
ncbi:MAG: DUF2177 family protein [Desulfuromonadales bacterium]|nr:DUF2177 family protein [Desulfuromonadales bacterium]